MSSRANPVSVESPILTAELRARCADPDNPHVVVAMSGGVDSSACALLLKRAGFRVTGVFMKNWNEPDDDGRCRWEDDVADVLDVGDELGIQINTVDLSNEYWDGVFEDFIREYRCGRTPNPDVLCNREVKFKAFLEHTRELGGDLMATGHYARSDIANGVGVLRKGRDPAKDQSYFMYAIGQDALARTLFPLGELLKSDVRKLAADGHLATHAKKDSTGICFIGEQRFRQFLSQYVPARPGEIRDLNGHIVGTHEGAAYYTLGQREGLGIGGVRGALMRPWYVVAKDVTRNELIVAQDHEHPLLMSSRLQATDLSWISGAAPSTPLECTAKTRYRQADQICRIVSIDDGRLCAEFVREQRAVTPGQSVVFYIGDECLGGGIIDTTE